MLQNPLLTLRYYSQAFHFWIYRCNETLKILFSKRYTDLVHVWATLKSAFTWPKYSLVVLLLFIWLLKHLERTLYFVCLFFCFCFFVFLLLYFIYFFFWGGAFVCLFVVVVVFFGGVLACFGGLCFLFFVCSFWSKYSCFHRLIRIPCASVTHVTEPAQATFS